MEQIPASGGSRKAVAAYITGAIIVSLLALGAWRWYRAAAPKVTVRRQGDNFVVKKNGQDVAGFDRAAAASNIVQVYKQTKQYAYIAAFPEGLEGGYLLFDPGVYKLFRFDLARADTYDWKDLSRGDTAAQAVSPDDRFVAYAEYGAQKNVVIRNIESGEEFKAPVAQHYGQFGSMQFSPDSQKLAYAAAIGFPGKESGAVFAVDVATKQARLVALTKEPDTYFVVKGWKNNEQVDYAIGPNLNPADKE